MTDIEWPEGATHRINGKIVKWVDGFEFNFECGAWEKPLLDWSLDRYIKEGASIIERPKELETEPYKPEVGGWCECSYPVKWSEVYYIGENSTGGPVIELKTGECLPVGSLTKFRPIKSERDQFIEKSLDINGAPKDWGEMFGMQYDEGARFTDE